MSADSIEFMPHSQSLSSLGFAFLLRQDIT